MHACTHPRTYACHTCTVEVGHLQSCELPSNCSSDAMAFLTIVDESGWLFHGRSFKLKKKKIIHPGGEIKLLRERVLVISWMACIFINYNIVLRYISNYCSHFRQFRNKNDVYSMIKIKIANKFTQNSTIVRLKNQRFFCHFSSKNVRYANSKRSCNDEDKAEWRFQINLSESILIQIDSYW